MWGVAFSPDGTRVASSWVGEDRIRVLDVATGEPTLEVQAGTRSLGDPASFSPDGARLAITNGSEVEVVEVATGDVVLRFQPNMETAVAVAWSPDGQWIASSSLGVETRLTDAETGLDHIAVPRQTGEVFALDWSRETGQLVTGARDGTARVWKVDGEEVVEQVAVSSPEGVGGIAFSPDGEQVLTGDVTVTDAEVWDVGLAGGAEWANLPTSTGGLQKAAFTPDGDRVVVSGRDAEAVVWDPDTGARHATLGEDQDTAVDLAVSPDGGLVATVSYDDPPRAQVWDPDTGEEVFAVEEVDFQPEFLSWSPDGQLLAVAVWGVLDGSGKTVIVDRTGQRVAELPEEANFRPADLVFVPDGERLVTARWKIDREDPTANGLRVWDWATGEVVIDMQEFPGELTVSPDGTSIAVSRLAGGGSIWDIASGERVATLDAHTGDISGLAYSPDGDLLATSGVDGTVRLWDTDSFTQELVLHSPDGPVWWVDFSPDGDRLVTTSDGVARVWALDLDDLVGMAEGRLTRSLTDVECLQYLHVERCPA